MVGRSYPLSVEAPRTDREWVLQCTVARNEPRWRYREGSSPASSNCITIMLTNVATDGLPVSMTK